MSCRKALLFSEQSIEAEVPVALVYNETHFVRGK